MWLTILVGYLLVDKPNFLGAYILYTDLLGCTICFFYLILFLLGGKRGGFDLWLGECSYNFICAYAYCSCNKPLADYLCWARGDTCIVELVINLSNLLVAMCIANLLPFINQLSMFLFTFLEFFLLMIIKEKRIIKALGDIQQNTLVRGKMGKKIVESKQFFK